jgi:lipopolysaccharide transport protein LptA/LPS export ABC transporter protein LptC
MERMATTTNIEPDREWRPKAEVLAATDRGKDFLRAHRHTRLVRFLRWSLPMSAAAVVSIYVAIVLQTVGWVHGLPQVELAKMIPANLAMQNPRYQGFNKEGGSYVVTAKTAVPDFTDLSRVTLNEINGDLTDANKSKTNLKAAHGLYNNETKELELYDGIDIVSETGMHARLTRATVFAADNIVVSKEPVVVDMPAGTIRSKQMTLHNKTRMLAFVDSVEAHLVPKEPPAGAPAKANSGGAPLISAGNGPIDITASRLDIDDTAKTATFSGRVRAVQGDAVLETDTLEVKYEGEPAGASTAAAAPPGTKIRRIGSRSPVVMTRAPQDRVTSQSLDFDAVSEVAVLTGDVVMTSGPERRVMSNAATIDQRADTVLLTGNVLAIQGRNELNGGRLFVERATGRTQLTTPPSTGAKLPGRITTRFYRSEDGPLQSVKEAMDAFGNGTAATAAVFQTDPTAPIDVEADRLDVDDRTKLAVFKGSVRATQADFVVRTAELRAFYNGQAGLAEQMNTASKSKEPAQLTRIEARGKVLVTSKNGQNATGDWANFNVKSNKVTLGGDVLLTQGKNVVHGTLLVIDMATGQSSIHEDPGAAWTAKAAPEGDDSGSGIVVQGPTLGGRPSAVFYPKARKTAPEEGQPPAADSPSTSTSDGAWGPSGPEP